MSVKTELKISSYVLSLLCLFQFKVNQYSFQRRVTKAIQFLRETGRKVIEVRKNAINRGEEVPDDILQRIIQQQGFASAVCIYSTELPLKLRIPQNNSLLKVEKQQRG